MPHQCTRCGARAYVGAREVECSNEACEHYNERFARSVKDTDPELRIPDLEDSTLGAPIYVPLPMTGPAGPMSLKPDDPGPTGPDDSTDELSIDWEYWDDYGVD